MGNCLVTKLNGVSDNKGLLKIGELVVSIECTEANKTLLDILLNGSYYCEKAYTLGSDNVAAYEVKNNTNWGTIKSKDIGTYTFHFLDKYSIGALLIRQPQALKGFSYINKITQLIISPTDNIDIEVMKDCKSLTLLSVAGNVSGDIASLKGLTALTSLSVAGNVSGDIASLKGLTALTSFIATYGDKITLKAGDFSDMPNLDLIEIGNKGTSYVGNFGDIATLGSNLTYIFLGDDKPTIEWTSRPSSSKIISIVGAPKLANIDKMLQDQANCVIGITSSSPDYRKLISTTGTRTSASDSAVATLQSKGYTVSVSPV